MNKVWKSFDQVESPPHFLDSKSKKKCYFAREYISEGYQASSDNQLIFNFKKPVSHKNSDDWRYKEQAIKAFVEDLAVLFSKIHKKHLPLFLTTIPTSKLRTDQRFDSRLDDVIDGLLKYNQNNNEKLYQYEEPITINNNTLSLSREEGSRSVESKRGDYKWNGFKNTIPKNLIVIDDVITSGASFIAYKKILEEQCEAINVIGLFWARTVKTK